jgi:LL-diaminopimelate aminotransferase
MKTSKRLKGINEYYFSAKLRELEELKNKGSDIINLGIGSPDLPPHPEVVSVLNEESQKNNVHGYQSYRGSPVLRQAMADWYLQWYGVELDQKSEILPLIGSKEGILHLCMTYLRKGDRVLVPDPGYPTYSAAVRLAEGKPVTYRLTAETNFEPDLEEIDQQHVSKVKMMFINYPHMPTGRNASRALFEKLVAFARKNKILLVHDNPYSFILNEQPLSILNIAGAKDTAVELNSLSKSHNMAGWRVGMVCGSASVIDDVIRFKSNMDSGMFLPLQMAAAKALSLGPEWYSGLNDEYRSRREIVFSILSSLSCKYESGQCGLFVWAEVPATFSSGEDFSDHLLYKHGVFITPGVVFGKAGRKYIRVSLCATQERLNEALQRVNGSDHSENL